MKQGAKVVKRVHLKFQGCTRTNTDPDLTSDTAFDCVWIGHRLMGDVNWISSLISPPIELHRVVPGEKKVFCLSLWRR